MSTYSGQFYQIIHKEDLEFSFTKAIQRSLDPSPQDANQFSHRRGKEKE